ncbi:TRAP transporter small permease [Ureibacillus sp. MALMAid1270]|uniref:TRAP transporter small permease n=1 Tax=Ureibacillus sp. MALMAid1270 TaxID=3411629 RepID=UPI003BA8251C
MKILDYFEEIILFITFLTITLITFANILSRNFFKFSFSFTEEITINLLVLLTFVGTALGVRRYAHLGFTLVYDIAGKLGKKVISLISSIISAGLFAILLYYGYEMVAFQMKISQTTPALGMPQWILSLALPIGALLCLIRTVQVTLEELKQVNNIEDIKDEANDEINTVETEGVKGEVKI